MNIYDKTILTKSNSIKFDYCRIFENEEYEVNKFGDLWCAVDYMYFDMPISELVELEAIKNVLVAYNISNLVDLINQIYRIKKNGIDANDTLRNILDSSFYDLKDEYVLVKTGIYHFFNEFGDEVIYRNYPTSDFEWQLFMSLFKLSGYDITIVNHSKEEATI